MPGPLTYFRYSIGSMMLRKTWVQRGLPHLFFSNSITDLFYGRTITEGEVIM